MNNIDSIKAYKDLILRLNEADEEEPAITPPDEAPVPAEEPAVTPPETDTVDQETDDKDIEDVMTVSKAEEPKKISVTTLATDLGLENPEMFKSAFRQLRKGELPDDEDEMRELGDAFFKIMTADATTTQRVINRLRSIYRKSSKPTA